MHRPARCAPAALAPAGRRRRAHEALPSRSSVGGQPGAEKEEEDDDEEDGGRRWPVVESHSLVQKMSPVAK